MACDCYEQRYGIGRFCPDKHLSVHLPVTGCKKNSLECCEQEQVMRIMDHPQVSLILEHLSPDI